MLSYFWGDNLLFLIVLHASFIIFFKAVGGVLTPKSPSFSAPVLKWNLISFWCIQKDIRKIFNKAKQFSYLFVTCRFSYLIFEFIFQFCHGLLSARAYLHSNLRKYTRFSEVYRSLSVIMVNVTFCLLSFYRSK